MIVLHDELDLPFGDVRLKSAAVTPGTTGCALSCQHLGTPDFVRVRIGVGRPPAGFTGEVADYRALELRRDRALELPEIVDKGVRSDAARFSPRLRARDERSEHAAQAPGRRRRARGTGGSKGIGRHRQKRSRAKSSREA